MSAVAAVFGVPDVDRIVAFARKLPVFPCAPNKRPRTAHGFHDASQDPALIRRWWADWPDSLVGVPTGQATGLVVIDYDPDKANQATHQWIADHTDLLCSTRIHSTQRGGKHYIFTSKERFQTGTDLVLDGSPRRGIDLRAAGGYVVWWPLHGAEVTGDKVAQLPTGLIDERKFDQARDMSQLPTATPVEWSRERDKVAEALTYLKSDGYEHWIRMGMAIHHASGGSDEGFALWHDWSARGDSYDGIQDCRYHWNSFGGYGGRALGVGTVYAAAKLQGFNPIKVELPPEEGDKPTARIVLRHLSDIVAERRESEWLLHKVIEANVLAVLAGQRGTFKSFIALDWAMRVAQAGQGVVMLSGEGAGLDRRADAWKRLHCPDLDFAALPFVAVERPVNLRLAVELAELSEAITTLPEPPRLVVVDTFSKFSAGIDENDNGEVSAFLAGLTEFIRDQFHATVLMVAHSGHGDAKRPRGASALMANPDAEYIVERPPQGMSVTVSRERFKDSAALEPLSYEAMPVDLGRLDAYGEPVTSLALVSSVPPPKTMKQPSGKGQRLILAGLRNLQKDNPTQRLFWSVPELREVGRTAGLNKATARSAAEWLATSPFLTPVAGGGFSLPVEECGFHA